MSAEIQHKKTAEILPVEKMASLMPSSCLKVEVRREEAMYHVGVLNFSVF